MGPVHKNSLHMTTKGVPFEQAISRQKLRPGSGFLSVNITTDGPTKVVEITDIQDKVRISKFHFILRYSMIVTIILL